LLSDNRSCCGRPSRTSLLNRYDGAFTKDEIGTFVTGNSLPLIMEFTDEAAPKIFGGQIKSHFLFFSKFSAPEWEANRGTLAAVGKKCVLLLLAFGSALVTFVAFAACRSQELTAYIFFAMCAFFAAAVEC
jgi:hypothetical protein